MKRAPILVRYQFVKAEREEAAWRTAARVKAPQDLPAVEDSYRSPAKPGTLRAPRATSSNSPRQAGMQLEKFESACALEPATLSRMTPALDRATRLAAHVARGLKLPVTVTAPTNGSPRELAGLDGPPGESWHVEVHLRAPAGADALQALWADVTTRARARQRVPALLAWRAREGVFVASVPLLFVLGGDAWRTRDQARCDMLDVDWATWVLHASVNPPKALTMERRPPP